jgi:hypothetical protein
LNQARTTSSSWLGPAESSHELFSMFETLAMKSPKAPGQVPEPGIKAK